VAAAEADRVGVDAGRAQRGQLVAANLLDGGAVLGFGQGGSSGRGLSGDRRMLPEAPPRPVAG
jgi:hypothetical protein